MPATRNTGALRSAIIILTLFTAIIHVWLGIGFLVGGGWAFVLNGAGYLTLLILYVGHWRSLAHLRWIVRWLFIAYTAITVIAWIFIGTGSPVAGPAVPSAQTLVAYVDKVMEVTLIVLLWLDGLPRFTDAR